MDKFQDFSCDFTYYETQRLWYAKIIGIGIAREKTPTQALSRLFEEAALHSAAFPTRDHKEEL